MSNTTTKERAAATADAIQIMVDTLESRGFSSEQAVRLVCAMLSSSLVYVPFAPVVAAPPDVTKH